VDDLPSDIHRCREAVDATFQPLDLVIAERVELEAHFLGDFSAAPTGPQQLLGLGRDLRRQHRGASWRTRGEV